MFTTFQGGQSGGWRVISLTPVRGATPPPMPALSVVSSRRRSRCRSCPRPTRWRLAGVASLCATSSAREKQQLVAVQAALGRREASAAALIPIRKNAAWWELTQEERRKIFEDKSHHIANSLKYLPAIARQLYHCRDLGEPFDFLTWFEYAPEQASAFEELVTTLRATEEWSYVEREFDLRLARED